MRKTMALVAHDAKKGDMVQLVKAHKEELAEVDLIAEHPEALCGNYLAAQFIEEMASVY